MFQIFYFEKQALHVINFPCATVRGNCRDAGNSKNPPGNENTPFEKHKTKQIYFAYIFC